MFVPGKIDKRWSKWALQALIVSVVATILLSIVDGIFKGLLVTTDNRYVMTILTTWTYDFRYFFEQCMFVAALLFGGAKFFETRTILTIGFDKIDTEKMTMKGPDEENVIWIGRRYANKWEAEAVAAVIEERFKQSDDKKDR